MVALGVLTLIALAAVSAAYVMAVPFIEQRRDLKGVLAQLADLQGTQRIADSAYAQALALRRAAEERRKALDEIATKLQKQFDSLADRPPELVHEIGDPLMRTGDVFAVTVAHRGSSGLVGLDGQPLNPIWNAAQLIEVWASSAERAKEVVEAKYPQNAGYRVLSVAFVGGPKATVST
jgi:hypothetical protein